MKQVLRFGLALGIASLLTCPLVVSAQAPQKSTSPCKSTKPVVKHLSSSASGAVFTFGIQGGNILPWSVTFNADGTVTQAGWEKPKNSTLAEPQNALNGLLALASSEGFFSMLASTNCAGSLPDIAARYVMINTGTTSRKVRVHGACVQSFDQLFAALENVADFQH